MTSSPRGHHSRVCLGPPLAVPHGFLSFPCDSRHGFRTCVQPCSSVPLIKTRSILRICLPHVFITRVFSPCRAARLPSPRVHPRRFPFPCISRVRTAERALLRVARIRIARAHACEHGNFPPRGHGRGSRCHTRVPAAGWDAGPCDAITCRPRPSPAQGNACAELGGASEPRPG